MIKDIVVPDLEIGQISLRELETEMKSIDWHVQESLTIFRLDDASTYEREFSIDRIVGDLMRLSATPEGKVYADALKVKFWSNTVMESLQGSLAAIRSKLEVSQRFYFAHGEVISVQEAYRFLQNRWMEKAMLAKRKGENDSSGDADRVTKGGEKTGRLVKKRKTLKGKRLS